MRLDYVVTLKNDYTEKEMLALCEQCNDETRSKDAIEFFAPMLIDVDRTTSFEQEGFVLHLHKNSEDDRPMALYEASNSKLSYDEWWDRTFKLKEGKVKVLVTVTLKDTVVSSNYELAETVFEKEVEADISTSYTVTFDSQGGTTVDSQKVKAGSLAEEHEGDGRDRACRPEV